MTSENQLIHPALQARAGAESLKRRQRSHHAKIVLGHESTVTRLAVVSVVALGPHMAICIFLGMEHGAARFTRVFWRPMSDSIHVLGSRTLRAKLLGAAFTLVSWSPVLDSIHVLVASCLSAKLPAARLALDTVVVARVVGLSIVTTPHCVQSDFLPI